ncbi:hypothetical protein [Marinobacter nauticus]|uniref:Uncharacterized protein n=1 Tax=Marinobacter nauticus (strain ATCC 700491 / DSM 11845 / VT8) TaxID=351348 RepID=A1U076_MARN8|nr:hypothetical protein [Marinobacter nauticus]ABM18395.1 hypothetical protein Maqu_1306 [Marinobacter nauticus VT8]
MIDLMEKIKFENHDDYSSGICQRRNERIYLTRSCFKLELRYEFSHSTGEVFTGLRSSGPGNREATAWPNYKCEMISIGLGEAVTESDIRTVNGLVQPYVSRFKLHYDRHQYYDLEFRDLQNHYVEMGRKTMLALATMLSAETLNMRASWPSVESAFRDQSLREFLVSRRTNDWEIYQAAFRAVFESGVPFHPYDIIALLQDYPGGPFK